MRTYQVQDTDSDGMSIPWVDANPRFGCAAQPIRAEIFPAKFQEWMAQAAK
jgi:hypothetical protein